jgi:subtilisin family serine protease
MSRRFLVAVAGSLVLVALAASARATRPQTDSSPLPRMDAPIVNPTRLLVKVRGDATREQVAAAHARVGAKVVKDLPQIRWQVVEIPYGRQDEIRALYAKESAIERADLDRARKVAYSPNDLYWPYEWHMTNIAADVAWNKVKGDPSVVVAIMDTGLDYNHQDLAANAWTNPGEIPGNGIDDDGNGYVDDVHGYDFAYGDGDPDDQFGHGTACAGIVAAVQDNFIGVTGVAPKCQVAGVKAANNSGYFYDSANVPALTYCADMGFKVVSMSFFADSVTPAERDAIDYCWSKGLVLVAAAGNSSSVIPYYPGAYENVVSVAATDGSNNPTWFTDYGSWVDVAAPGVGIYTTTPGNNYTGGFAGTSGACPHVAGLAALLFAANPSATNGQVRAALEDTANATVWAPWGGEYTNYGKVACDAAVDRVQGLTSGHKPPRFLFAAPCGGTIQRFGPGWPHSGQVPVGLYGVGFESPNTVLVTDQRTKLPILSQSRRNVTAILDVSGPTTVGTPSAPHLLHFGVNGTQLQDLVWDTPPGLCFAPTDVGTYGGTVTGGFLQMYRVDGSLLTCTQSGGGIYCEMPVRKVLPLHPNQFTVEFTRSYSNCNGGSETLYLYDWSTWSYPYGSWTVVWSRGITSSAMETVTATIATNPDHYIDDSGTMYFVLSTGGAASNGQLNADCFRVRTQ